jgi:hypothetical protein
VAVVEVVPAAAVPPAETLFTIVPRAKVIHPENPASATNRHEEKTKFRSATPNVKTARDTKTKMFRRPLTKRPKAKAPPKQSPTNRTKLKNFTKNAPPPIANVRKCANARPNGCVMIAAVDRSVDAIAVTIAATVVESVIEIATVDADAATKATDPFTACYAVRSIAFATVSNRFCATSNASSAPCSKRSTNAS